MRRLDATPLRKDLVNARMLRGIDCGSTIGVRPSGTGSLVTWMGAFKRADQGDAPAADMRDEPALAVTGSVHEARLEARTAKPQRRRLPAVPLAAGGCGSRAA